MEIAKSKTFLRQKQASSAVRTPIGAHKEAYNPKFVAKILESQQQIADGQYRVIETDDLWK
jgi:hypothetical protein